MSSTIVLRGNGVDKLPLVWRQIGFPLAKEGFEQFLVVIILARVADGSGALTSNLVSEVMQIVAGGEERAIKGTGGGEHFAIVRRA
jgi:hypothetical protein